MIYERSACVRLATLVLLRTLAANGKQGTAGVTNETFPFQVPSRFATETMYIPSLHRIHPVAVRHPTGCDGIGNAIAIVKMQLHFPSQYACKGRFQTCQGPEMKMRETIRNSGEGSTACDAAFV